MRARVRGPNGQAVINLPATATILDLQKEISRVTSLQHFDVKYGYPPKPLSLEQYPDKNIPLLNLEVSIDGEILTVSEGTAPVLEVKEPPRESSTGKRDTPAAPLTLSRRDAPKDTPEIPVPTYGSTMVLRVMPDDNSCLFRAFSSAVLGHELDSMHELRAIIAAAIQADRDTYNAVVLEKAPDDYCRWIQKEDAWGGGIELGILAQHFDIEICTVDVQTCSVARFNEGRPRRIILVYSGIHYDVIALSPSDPPYARAVESPELDTKLFESAADVILEHAVELCRVLQGQHYYTDTQGFLVKCNTCGYLCTGESEVQEHARSTSHTDFGEAD